MFSYYGSKRKIAHLYPVPKYQIIIEPFAGAAWYSSQFPIKNVILNDSYDVVFGIWNWLINRAGISELEKYSNLFLGEDIRNIRIEQPHKDLLGFIINRGCTHPCNIVQKWSCQVASRPAWASTVHHSVQRIIRNMPMIRTWEVFNEDYRNLPDIEATWFIDPPYQHGGKYYNQNKIDYAELAEWVKSRKGQVIVCENDKAAWLPFHPLVQLTGQRYKTIESVWTN